MMFPRRQPTPAPRGCTLPGAHDACLCTGLVAAMLPTLAQRTCPGSRPAACRCYCSRLLQRRQAAWTQRALSSGGADATGRNDGAAGGEARDRAPRRPINFPWLHWGFRDGEEVSGYCLPTAMKVVHTMRKVPFSSVEDQLEARGKLPPGGGRPQTGDGFSRAVAAAAERLPLTARHGQA